MNFAARTGMPRSKTSRRRAAAGLALLAGALLAPASASTVAAQEEETTPAPIVIEGAYRPSYRIVPPSTDPQAPLPNPSQVRGFAAFRGTVVHGEGDLVLVNFGRTSAVVRLPRADIVAAEALPEGAAIEVTGPTYGDAIMDAARVKVWPTSAEGPSSEF